MIRARFNVRLEHPWSPPGWIRVVVYDDVEHLRRDAGRYSPGFDHSDTEACFQGRDYTVELDEDDRVTEPASPYAGTMRLLTEHGAATIAHEATHAALAMYARQHRGTLDLTEPESIDDEEVLCYAVGDIVGGVVSALLQRGVWPA